VKTIFRNVYYFRKLTSDTGQNDCTPVSRFKQLCQNKICNISKVSPTIGQCSCNLQ
jgi:hypothetical protein